MANRAQTAKRIKLAQRKKPKKKKPYCEICRKKFAKTNNLTRHMKYVHKKITQIYECIICSSHIIHRRNLTSHIQRVHKKTLKQAKPLALASKVINTDDHLSEVSDVELDEWDDVLEKAVNRILEREQCIQFLEYFGLYPTNEIASTDTPGASTSTSGIKIRNLRPRKPRKQAEKMMVEVQREEKINKKKIGRPNIPNMHKNIPPPYKKIKLNKVTAKFYGSVELNLCKCKPTDPVPCSSGCENAMLNIECHPKFCPAKDKCQNQNFRRGEQFKFQVKMTNLKGWGLYAAEKIPIGKFVIEYIGEVIDNVEFDQRFKRSVDNKEDKYYFLTLGQNLYIDAAAYGNESRFINHSCNPNVVPEKWNVHSNGKEYTRIGFFALRDILPGEEIVFDYNWGRTEEMETVCRCGSNGSKKCRGYI